MKTSAKCLDQLGPRPGNLSQNDPKTTSLMTSLTKICTKLSQRASFFLKASVLFLSAKIFVQDPGMKLVQMAKYMRQLRKLTHIPSKINSANWESLSLTNCFVSSSSSRKRQKNSSSWQTFYFCMEKMFMLWIHTSTHPHGIFILEFNALQLATSLTIFTALFRTFSNQFLCI